MCITAWIYIIFLVITPVLCDAQFSKGRKIEKLILKEFDSIEFNDIGRTASAAEIKAIINRSQQINFDQGQVRGLILLQRNALRQNDYTLSENYGDQAKKIAIKLHDEQALSLIHLNRVRANIGLGFYSEAKQMLFNEAFGSTIHNKVDRSLYLANSNMLLAGIYSKQEIKDSVIYYTRKSLETIESIPINSLNDYQKVRYYYLLIFQLMNMGIAYAYKLDPPQHVLAESLFLQALSYSKTHPQYFKLCNIEVYESLSSFYLTKGDFKKCIEFSKKVLELQRIKNKPEERLDAYMNIKEANKALGNTKEEFEFLQLYQLLSDSLKNAQKKDAINLSRKKIDNYQKESSINYFDHKLKLTIGTIGATVIIVLSLSYHSVRKQRQYKRNYELLIQRMKTNEKHTEEFSHQEKSGTSNISEEVQKRILKKLKMFEQSEKYLRKDTTLTSLANLLGTNPKYLSEIIKSSKSQNFNGYINSLKINFIVQKLYNSPEYRDYKISFLAEKCGYASPQVFVIAFKKEYGVTPSYFINQLNANIDKTTKET